MILDLDRYVKTLPNISWKSVLIFLSNTAQCQKMAHLSMLEKVEKLILEPDQSQNLIDSCLGHTSPTNQILLKSVHSVFWVILLTGKKERKLDLYSAPLWEVRLWSAQAWITQFLGCKVHHTCLYLVKHSSDGATTDSDNSRPICSLLLIYRPREVERLSWLSGQFTHIQ